MDQKTGLGDQMPASIGRYQVQGDIGYGAMGAVYKAFDPLIKRTLAIKTIRLDIPRSSPQYKSFIERFYHEARISGTLSHPNIVTLFDIGEEHAIPYLAMEFVEGDTISSLIEEGVKFPPEKVISLVSQVASAIDYAHSKGVIHRDIKPSNMILSEDRLKVTDFGIAKLVDSEMTQSGQLLGTPSYMSPEQAMGDKLDGRSDIFSLGVCAFEMLSGEQPFPGTNVTSILYKLVHVDPIEPANLEMNGLVPQKWHEVFSKVLAKKPDDRYQTAAEFVQDLEYCLGSWFGGMGSESSADVGATVALAAVSGRIGTEVPPPGPPEITAAIARDELQAPPAEFATLAPAATIQSAVTRPSIELTASMPGVSPSAPAEADSPMTVQMNAPKLGDSKPPPPAAAAPPPEEDYGTVAIKAPYVRTTRELPDATVSVKASPSAASAAPPARPRPEPSTLPLPPTIRQRAPVLDMPTVLSALARPAPATPPPVAPAARSGISPLLVLGLAGGFFFLAIALAAIVWLRQRSGATDAPTPAPVVDASPFATLPVAPLPPAAITGSLHIETLPSGASVFVNGEARGNSPLDLTELAVGSYRVRAELRGHSPASETATILVDAPNVQLKLTLALTAAAQGSVEISSDPSGATVVIDGRPAGQTPIEELKLKPGAYRVEVLSEGHEPWAGSVTIEAGKKARVAAALETIPQATPTPPPQLDTTKIYLNTASDVDQLAKKLSGPSVSYPSGAPRLRSGDSVSVSVTFVVDETGGVVDPKVIESAGKQIDDAVLSAMRNWKYQPATKQGIAVKVKITFKQTFRAG